MSASSQRLAHIASCLALSGLILGTAAQSMILFLATALALLAFRPSLKQLLSWTIWAPRPLERWAFLAFCGWIAWSVLATLLNPANSYRGFASFIFTHAALLLAPPLWGLCWRLQGRSRSYWSRFVLAVLLVWTLVALSQALIGWQLEGVQMVFHEHYKRARGFYSHPLTLAYVLLVIWPYFLIELLHKLNSPMAWAKVGCLCLMFTLSASRSAQIAVLLSLVWGLSHALKGRERRLAFALLFGLVAALAFTDNPASQRFKRLFDPQDPDRFSDYADDRLAFWHAFSGMVAERPLLGHGLHLDKQYRIPYYEAIGLGDFKKQYEAHNQLLQLLAEGGIIGLGLFLLWLVLLVLALSREHEVDRYVLGLTLAVFIVAGLTQNSFQDFEVRYALILMLSLARGRTPLAEGA